MRYTTFRNKLSKLMKLVERNYYSNILRHNQQNLSNSWKIINNIINNYKQKRRTHDNIIIDGIKITNAQTISAEFNKYFVNIGKNLSKAIVDTTVSPTSFIKQVNTQSIYVSPVNEEEVSDIIKDLKLSSPGLIYI